MHEARTGCGKVREVRLTRDAKGLPRGFAYVEFEEKEAVGKALQCDGAVVEGRKVEVLPNNDEERTHGIYTTYFCVFLACELQFELGDTSKHFI